MYQPNRGGHAPGHLRDAFVEMIESDPSITVDVDGEPRPARWLRGQLWNCTDCLPGSVCSTLEIPQGSTYAQAARHLAARAE